MNTTRIRQHFWKPYGLSALRLFYCFIAFACLTFNGAAQNASNIGKGDWIRYLTQPSGSNPNATNILNTDVQGFVDYEKAKGIQWIAVKCGDGDNGINNGHYLQFSADLISRCHQAGLKIFAWAFVYGGSALDNCDAPRTWSSTIQGEIAVANAALALGPDGFIIDAECSYETNANNRAAAVQYCQGIRASFPNAFLAYTPFPYISKHSAFPYVEFGTNCNAVMPQDYWVDLAGQTGGDPVKMVSDMDSEWSTWQNSLTGTARKAIIPIVPVAQANGAVSGSQITTFVNALKIDASPATTGGYKGVSFWYCEVHTTSDWDAIGAVTIGDTRIIALDGTLSFGNVPAQTSAQLPLTINNSGNAPLNVSAITYPSGFNGDWSGGQIAPGGSQIVNVIFSPSSSLTYGGNIVVNSDATSGPNTIPVSGTGTPATVSYVVTPSAGPNGSITPSQPQTVGSGWNVNFTASPSSGYTVDQWFVNGSSVQIAGTSFILQNVSADTSIQVTFKAVPNEPLIVTGGSLPSGSENTSYSQSLQASGGTSPYSWSVVSGSLPPNLYLDSVTGTISGTALVAGTYTFRVRVTDTQSLFSEKDFSMTITAVTGPSISISSNPQGPMFTSAQVVALNASAASPSGIAQVQFWDGPTLRGTSYTPPYTYNWSITSGDNGTHRWMAVAFDSQFHQSSVTVDLTVLIGPGITITNPASGSKFIVNRTYRSIPVIAFVTEQSPLIHVTSVGFYDNGPQYAQFYYNSPTYTYNWSFNSLDAGVHQWFANMSDDAGQHTTSPTVTVTIIGDDLPPQVSIASPPSNSIIYNANPTLVAVSASDNVGLSRVELYNNGVLKTNLTNPPFTYLWTSADPMFATNNWKAKAYDQAGNVSESTTNRIYVYAAPQISVPPANQIANVQNGATFSLTALGTSPMSYQWFFNNSPLTNGGSVHGATSSALTLSGIDLANAGNYSVVVSNAFGAVSTAINPANLVVVGSPASQAICRGSDAQFCVPVASSLPVHYQWRSNSVNIANATNSCYTRTNVQPTNTVTYSVVVTNQAGSISAPGATLTVRLPVTITTNLPNKTVVINSNVTFCVGAVGTPSLGYQWLFNGQPVANQSLSCLTIANVQPADQGTYSAIVSNVCGTAITSNNLTVVFPPYGVIAGPTIQFVTNGQSASFSATASGTPNLHYQWLFNGTPLTDGPLVTGSTTADLILNTVTTNSPGYYAIVVTNAYGAVTSSVSTLVVIAPQAINIMRTFGSPGDGASPAAEWVLSGETLFGTTHDGGLYNSGTIFAVKTNGSGFRVIYDFTGSYDGANPQARLILSGGTLYGTTVNGGPNAGTVFSIGTNGALFNVLHGFTGGLDGGNPGGGLAFAGTTLYGTTMSGGAGSNGAVFSLNTNGLGFSVLHNFSGADGSSPQGTLVLAANSLFGITSYGGTFGKGTVFSISTNGLTFTNLHSFANGSDGAGPQDGLLLWGKTLYGTAFSGGTNAYGTVFGVATNGASFNVIYSFTGDRDGANPQTALSLSGNLLYGATGYGGDGGQGTVFCLSTNGGLAVLYAFSGDWAGGSPSAGNLVISGKAIYGTAQSGGTNYSGVAYNLSPLPVIVTQPTNCTVSSGGAASFGVAASGTPPLGYQWRSNGIALAGATSATLMLSNVTRSAAYTVLVTNTYGSVTSSNAVLTLISGRPTIAVQPQSNLVVDLGQSAQFAVTAYGTLPLSYQWRFNGLPVSGGTASSLVLSVPAASNSGNYTVVITNISGGVTSSVANLTVYTGLPAIVTQPQSQIVAIGEPASFSVVAHGALPLSYQWWFNSQALIGATNSLLTLPLVTNAGNYSVVITNVYGSVTSAVAVLSNALAPLILVQPQSLTAYGPGPASFTVLAYGTTPLSYQWLFNGGLMSGQSNVTLSFSTVSTNNPGSYRVIVTNAFGSATSDVASLTLVAPRALTLLHPFGVFSDAANPVGTLALSGNSLYGLTPSGGTNSSGAIFSINTNGSGFSVLYNFSGGADGLNPYGNLLVSGNMLYGTASYGGSNGLGCVFAMKTDGTGFNVLHSFNGTDGANPYGGLVMVGPALYGTTSGEGGAGTVFCVGTNGSGFRILYTFTGGADGYFPAAGLIASGSTLYGSTLSGGTSGYGGVFSINTNSFGFTNFYSFSGGLDGAYPYGTLVRSGNTLFGTTYEGGTNGYGSVFAIRTNGTVFNPLYSFSGGWDGANPYYGGLTLSGSTLYGTTSGGSTNSVGSVFSMSTSGGSFKTIYAFTGGSDGASPQSGVALSGSTLYGSTSSGGQYGGTIFSLTTSGGFQVLYAFTSGVDGANPVAALVAGNAMYGTTAYGGDSGSGTIFSVKTNGSGYRLLHTFTDQGTPQGGLLLIGSRLYGTSMYGGSNNLGTIFSISTNGTGYTVHYNFGDASSDGHPQAGLIVSGGTLYGTASSGGSNGYGTVFSVRTNGVGFSSLYSFTGGSDGSAPDSSLVLSGNTLYGTTPSGGANSLGNIFSVRTNGTLFSVLYSFKGDSDGNNPSGGLVLSGTKLYGAAAYGGPSGNGTLYSISTAGTNFTLLYPFSGGSDGANPQILSMSGNTLYGTSTSAGDYGYGTVFLINTNGTGLTVLYTFTGNTDGGNPNGVTALGNILYGTASGGGALSAGTAFGLSPLPSIVTQPTNVTVPTGATATFSVDSAGALPLSYQWRTNGVAIKGATNLSLLLPNVTTNKAGNYTVVVNNPYGSTTSRVTVLTVTPPLPNQPAFIITQPHSLTVVDGQSAQFQVAAYADTYQWFLNNNVLSGGTNSLLSLSVATTNDAGAYTVVAENAFGSATSDVGVLTVVVPPPYPTGVVGPKPPLITSQPRSLNVIQGQSAEFLVRVSGTGPFNYQWQFNSTPLIGATTATLTLPSVSANNAGNYNVLIGNSAGSAVSSVATLTVLVPPSITIQPQSLTTLVGESAQFDAIAIGTAPLSYQWLFNGTNLSGATRFALVFTNVTLSESGVYAVIVTNIAGAITSSNANLYVYSTIAPSLDSSSSSAGQVQFSLTGVPGYSYIIQASTNMNDWTSICTNVAPFIYYEGAVAPYRFYRAVFMPP